MKKKDIYLLLLTVVILLVGAFMVFTQLVPSTNKSASTGDKVAVEKVGAIPPDFDLKTMAELNDRTLVQDFSQSLDVNGNFGNTAPFGQ